MKKGAKLLFIAILITTISCKNDTKNNPATEEIATTPEVAVVAEPRALNEIKTSEIFQLKPSEIYSKDSLPKAKEAYCVIVDWILNNSKNSIVAFKSGETSIFLNGIDIQFEKNPQSFNSLSSSLVEKAEKSLSLFTPTTERIEPDQTQIKIYVLTGDGKYFYQSRINEIKNSEIHDIFDSGKKLLLESRKAL